MSVLSCCLRVQRRKEARGGGVKVVVFESRASDRGALSPRHTGAAICMWQRLAAEPRGSGRRKDCLVSPHTP